MTDKSLRERLGSSTKPMLIMLAAVALIGGALYGFVNFRSAMIKQFLAAGANPPQAVSVVAATQQEWRPSLSAVGTFRAVSGADLSLEASGVVEKILFQSGEEVAAGQILLELRKDTDKSRLDALKATAELSEINLRRDQAQLKLKAVAQATVDTDLANLKSAKAEIAQQEALIAQKTLRAPFAGRLGLRTVDVGQYLAAGAPVVTLQALDTLFLDFVLPQQTLSELEVGQAIHATVDAWPGQKFAGKIVAINPKVDQASRNVQVRGAFANGDRRLRPGMFAQTEVAIGKSQKQITLPQTAIVYAPYGASVYLAQKPKDAAKKDAADKESYVAQQAFVQLGATRGDEVAVLKGLSEGALVVSAGQMKLRNGAIITISKEPSPPIEADPKPVDQ